MDIELYNYVHILLHDYHSGQLKKNRKQVTTDIKYEEEPPFEKGQLRLHAGVSFIPIDKAPPGIVLHRNNSDFMNNFYVSIVARTFTNIENTIDDF